MIGLIVILVASAFGLLAWRVVETKRRDRRSSNGNREKIRSVWTRRDGRRGNGATPG